MMWGIPWGAQPGPVIVYTTAPDHADFDYTKTLMTFKLKDKTWRKVKITPAYKAAYQCDLYRTHGHLVVASNPLTVPLDQATPAPGKA